MEENKYVLLDLVSITVNTKTTANDTIVFCDSITVKKREDQSFDNIDDWSNIIIGDINKYNVTGEQTIDISEINNTSNIVTLKENIGLWSVILFETIKTTTDEGEVYTKLQSVISGSSDIGGSGIGETGVKEVYFNPDDTDETRYANADVVNDFLKDVLGNTYGRYIFNGCIFIDNTNCGIILNISPKMFNEQEHLKRISLTNTINYIDSNKGNGNVGVFSKCINLESANIPKYLDNYFEYNDKNNNYDKPKTSRVIPSYYFYNCDELTNITIPDGIHNIESGAFYGCDKVETINIPPSVVNIGSSSLVTVNMSSDRYINVNGNDDDDKTNITFFEASVGYDNNPIDDGKDYIANNVIINISNRNIVKLSAPLISGNLSFVKNISTNSKIYIDCKTIVGVELKTDNQVKKYSGGFINTNFNTIHIGPSVESICNFAFYKVTGTNLILDNGKVLAIKYTDNSDEDVLEENKHGNAYLVKTPFVKSNFNSIHILNCASIGQYALHTLHTNELKFFENGYNYEINSEDKIIENTTPLKTLGDYAFYNSVFNGCLTIPSTVTIDDNNHTNISNTSFLQTGGLLELNCNISNYITVIDESDKKHTGILVNSKFNEIDFNYIGSIPLNILYENTSINSIKLGEGITQINGKAFYLCTNLTGTLTIPSSLEYISSDAFVGCRFNNFVSVSDVHYQTDDSGMYLLTKSYFDNPNESTIVLFANKHDNIQQQLVDNTFSIIENDNITGIGDYAFAYAFSDYANSNVYAINIPDAINKFGRNVFYNCTITRITLYSGNIPEFNTPPGDQSDIEVYYTDDFITGVETDGSFSDLEALSEVYVGYTAGVLLSSKLGSIDVDDKIPSKRTNFLHNTLRNSYLNKVADISKITIYVYEGILDDYIESEWEIAGYKISGIPQGVEPSKPEPPVGNDDEYDADVDDPEGEEWPDDGGNGDITTDEDYIPPIDNSNPDTGNENDDWIKPTDNGFNVPITQLGTPSIKVYGCRLDLLNPTYHDTVPTNTVLIDNFGNINLSALDYLKFNKVSDKTNYGSEYDTMLKLYMGDYGNNFLIVFTVTGIDNFDATTKLFTSGVEYATHRESNWLKTEIVRITKKPESVEYYVVLLCTCLKLQNKDNYNCRNAIVSVNYGSQMLDGDKTTTKIRVIQHKTELRLSNNSREINITDLPVLFCKDTKRTTFTGNFFIGFPKNFWSTGLTINNNDTNTNKNKLREYINDYFRILYDKEKIKIVGQTTKIDGLDYTYTFDVADDKYANIKETGSTTSMLTKFSLCQDKLSEIHEEYYYVNFKIENLKTTLAGGVWNISIYNIGEPAEMLNIQAIENQTDIPSISLFSENVSVNGKEYDGESISTNSVNLTAPGNQYNCHSIHSSSYVVFEYFIPIAITNLPIISTGVIQPEVEVVDLCVDSSCIFECGAYNTVFGTGEAILNNYHSTLTLNISTTQKITFPISSSTLKRTSLSSIKYTSTSNIKNKNTGLYGYYQDSTTNIVNCYSVTNIMSIKCIGSHNSSDILENTTAFLYNVNTGVSCLPMYNNFLSISDNDLKTNSNSDVDNTNLAYHNENYNEENNLCFYGNLKIVYDKFYNVLAPFYPYSEFTTKYKTDYSDSSQILVNQFIESEYTQLVGDSTATMYKNTLYTYIEDDSKKTATGPTYYCTSATGVIITVDEGTLTDDKFNIYTGQAYLVTDTNYNKINIAVDTYIPEYTPDSTNNKYNNTGIYSNATTVTLHPLYTLRIDDSTGKRVNSEIGSDDLKPRYINDLKHGLVVEVIRMAYITFTANNTSDSIVYNKGGVYYDINNNEFDITTLYTCSMEDIEYDKFVYIDNSSSTSFTDAAGVLHLYEDVFSNVNDIERNEFNRINININNVNADYTLKAGDSIYDNNGSINTTPIPKIKEESFTTNSLNIGNTLLTDFDKSVDQTRFRQVFLNFYYSILDNGVKTKVYADNTDGILMHLRLINKTPDILLPEFTATNFNMFNVTLNTINSGIFSTVKPITPVYLIKK